MEEQHIQAMLISLLKENNIKLWNPPYTTDSNEAGHERMQELAVSYSQAVKLPLADVEAALEVIRTQAVKKGKGNQTYRETNVATLELILPKEIRQGTKKKDYLDTKLDITTQELMTRITEKFEIKHMKLILNGKTLSPDEKLSEQKVKNNSKIMVLKVSEPEEKKAMMNEEKKRHLNQERLQRTQKGFQILSERDGSEDPATTPFLEIADQKGNPIQIPPSDKKALILAMGFHEKGRALMKRKDYDAAICHLLSADEQFSKCGSALLNMVDNYAVLQLDILWCYRALEALNCLDDAKQRLQRAETCFLNCYGVENQRLKQIKGTTGGEEVLFLRLYILQSLLTFLEGKGTQASEKLKKAEELYRNLSLDSEKMNQMMVMGFSEQETRLGLRACRGNMLQAVEHITHRNKEREEMKRMEQEKRRTRVEAINTLAELGYNKKAAAKALHETKGNVDEAYRRLLDSGIASRFEMSQPDTDQHTKVDQMAYLGFQREDVEAALQLMGDNVAQATQLLVDNQGFIPPELRSPSEPSTSSEDSTASGSSSLDIELVNEVLEDIPRHEEDYLDITLEEEGEVIVEIKSLLDKTTSAKKSC